MCSFISILSHDLIFFQDVLLIIFGGATEMANSNQSQENFLTRNGYGILSPRLFFLASECQNFAESLVYQISILFSTNLGN